MRVPGHPTTRSRSFDPARRRSLTALALLSGVGLVTTLASGPALPAAAAATGACASMTTPLYYELNPTSHASLMTTSKTEAANASTKYGFRAALSPALLVSNKAGTGLAGVHRMFLRGDFIYAFDSTDISALKAKGYADQGVGFYVATAATADSSCSVAVQRYTLNGAHQVSAPTLSPATLKANKWVAEDQIFYAAPTSGGSGSGGSGSGGSVNPVTSPGGRLPTSYTTPPLTSSGASDTDGTFTVAVLPDTQLETGTDTRFADRNRWLVSHRKSLDLRFATQVGDLVNWDTPSHDQYTVASKAMSVFEQAGLPWSPTVGNHDGAAVCPGGAACPGTDVRVGLRNTTTFNSFFPLDRFRAVRGYYESGKIDNTYSEFSAEGKTWMMLNLELWPRQGVIDWANQVVKAHPHDNVLLVTHSYLTGSGAINADKEYGANSPKYLYDNLISKNTNIKVVLSGHVGSYASRTDSRSGDPVTSFLQCFHDNHDNPTRLLTINTKTGTVRGQVYYQKSDRYLSAADVTYSGMKWVN